MSDADGRRNSRSVNGPGAAAGHVPESVQGGSRGRYFLVSTAIQLDAKRLSGLIGLGYEATLDASAWRGFVNETAAALGCQLAILEYHDADNPGNSFAVAGGLDGFESAYSSTPVHGDDDLFWLGMRDKPPGTVRLGTEILEPAILRQTRLYMAMLMPWRLEHFLFGAITTGSQASAFLSLARTDRETDFAADDKDLVSQLLLAHLRRSIIMQRELASLRGVHRSLATALEHAPAGAITFNGLGQPVDVNAEAWDLCSAGDGLMLRDGTLQAADPAVTAQLDRALESALCLASGGLVAPPPPILVTRRSGQPAFQVTFSPLGVQGSPAVIAVINAHPRSRAGSATTGIPSSLGLSGAELRLCEALIQGQTLLEAATSLNISRNTAKTHLARIFDKTGVHSQSALIRLLARAGGCRHSFPHDLPDGY